MNPTQTQIKTERLLLKPVSHEYKEEIFKNFTKKVALHMYPQPTGNIKYIEDFINKSVTEMEAGENLQLVILDSKTEEFLGCAGLHHIDKPDPELGIWLKETAQGKSYGKEVIGSLISWARNNLKFNHLRYPVSKANIASRKVAEHFGGKVAKEFTDKNKNGQEFESVEYWIK